MGKLLPRRPLLIALIALTTACTVQQTKVPSLTGPSEFGLSVTLTAQPDIITRDGLSQSTITITARDPNGAGLSGVQFRVDMAVANALQDFGTLSSRFVFTGSDGRAIVRYTSPSPPVPGTAVLVDRITIVVVPVDSNYQAATTQTADIRLVLPVIVGGNTPIPQFAFAPTNPAVGTVVNFDASSSTAPTGRTITTYSWNWGDGEKETGIDAFEEHDFQAAGTFIVILTVTDSAGVSASTSRAITVGT
jgi:hypothetical protein